MTVGLNDDVRALILAEQQRQAGQFITGVDVESYLVKLEAHAEILSDSVPGRCRGFVAYYCNDQATRRAYITLVLVHPDDRGSGLGRTLVECVLNLARQRGFGSCRLEVGKDNRPARHLYAGLGFRAIEDRGDKELWEVAL
jgi:ribosomal protein S18 acetylase RimI-like enzyme